jgi:hypothetical protein
MPIQRFTMIISMVLVFTLAAVGRSGEVALNYEFSDEPHALPQVGVLGSPGGGYWNRVDSDVFVSTFEFDRSMVRDEFGNSIPPGDIFAFPPTQLVPVPRQFIVLQADIVDSPIAQGPAVGSLFFGTTSGPVNVTEMIYAFPQGRYDIAVYYRSWNTLPGVIKLSDVVGNPMTDPTLVVPQPGGYSAAIFTDVRPNERHIGEPNTQPMGFGVSYYSNVVGESPLVEIAGIQIRGHIPEPAGLATAGWLCMALVARRRR